MESELPVSRWVIQGDNGHTQILNGPLLTKDLIKVIVAARTEKEAVELVKKIVNRNNYQAIECSYDYYRREQTVNMKTDLKYIEHMTEIMVNEARARIEEAIAEVKGK